MITRYVTVNDAMSEIIAKVIHVKIVVHVYQQPEVTVVNVRKVFMVTNAN
ncbi:hypothetical protein LOAG_15421 [Loa loa]|uniref:Uncharacterized protein n=1 Tax=Loa loa TaxID=7209 RepID=A0A1S0TH35_LOALO|nr:hypothetical protein LOAG_15421 [Loa loa]EFO13109.1 hypothetical protein LOAG_15421 [Loa loa]